LTNNTHVRRVALTLLAALSLGTGIAAAQAPGSAYIVTYIEVDPAATAQAMRLLVQQRDASRNDAGSVIFEALQRMGRRNQFVVLEQWRDAQAQSAHSATAHTHEFLQALAPLRITPYDERPHTALSIAAPKGSDATLYVVTHVDIIPTSKEIGVELVENFAAESRSDQGNVRFDVLTQSSRPNHMTVVEVWANEKAQRGHAVAAHTQKFREALLPLSGSLYDERLYRAVR